MSDHSFIPKANPKIVPPAIPAPRKESLEQENARLKAEVEHWQEQWHFVIQDNNKQMDEIAQLKAEVKRLDAMANECEHLHKGIYSLSLNVVQLKDDVERLRKAGDDVCESPYLWENDPAVIAWHAAKDGNSSV